ncbi:transposase [Parasediminibacterium sp. JCM 36343]|uniref:transposase n=1 Tax=Parasediminibacterium sp. JCM 36343 TaxID=3374279 RepID=UPI00397B87CA
MKNNEIPLLPETIYHIYNHANGNENLFLNNENYLYFLKRYAFFIQPIAHTYAYCLMPNHLHLVVKVKDEKQLQEANIYFQQMKNIAPSNIKLLEANEVGSFVSKVFGNLFSAYSQSFNKQQGRRGSLFMPNFKRKIIDNEAYYAKLIFYIHNNPVHHGFVSSMDARPFSSYKTFLSDSPTKISKQEVMDWFGTTDEFVRFHKTEKIDSSFEL